MAKTVPCLILTSYNYMYLFYFGDFGWSADALIDLFLVIRSLYDTNSAIIQFTLADLKGPEGIYNLHRWKPFIITSNLSDFFCLLL